MQPQTYLQHRRLYEAAFWILIVGVHAVANSITTNIDLARSDLAIARWEPWVWECSSAVALLALVPLLVAVDRRFPLERGRVRRSALAHLAFSVPFSLLHVAAMVALRELAYAAMGYDYRFGDWRVALGYEYLKDVRTYGYFLAILYLYRFALRRWQGEAGFLTEGREDRPAEPVVDRFLIKKLGREFLVRVDDIDWIEAAGNYVTLHVGERLYPLRETMAGIQARLEGQGFARVHRSAIVNLDRVREIEPFDTGDARAHMHGGGVVAVSRRYRQALKERLA
ncbi:LytTR family DNA-binding domain-containing protein [Luteimonas sp. RD2P54]|uniref:LytTR family DNA-binding domain-containing protein n=1 Tax=Luteimonas endophytica TaxID=3042023 RepID=A0ABT6JAX1_9GAMM|nr:LytTR family DNA-binding domain-containing protein [Luteimonas endophytica]MDH5823975.1 LytTR family DNA-binding domain-containing protein [Luteimonas endophytica]